MTNMEIGKRIREIRKERNISREKLAEEVELSSKFLYEVEFGRKGLSAESLRKITQVLSTSSDYLLTGEGEKCPREFKELNPRQRKRLERMVKMISEFWEEK